MHFKLCQWCSMVYTTCLLSGCGPLFCPSPQVLSNTITFQQVTTCQNRTTENQTYVDTFLLLRVLSALLTADIAISHYEFWIFYMMVISLEVLTKKALMPSGTNVVKQSKHCFLLHGLGALFVPSNHCTANQVLVHNSNKKTAESRR